MSRSEWIERALKNAPKLSAAAKSAIRSALPPVPAVAR